MAARRKPPPRWSRPAAEGAIVMTALALAFGAGAAGFVVGRETAEPDEPAAAETSETTTEATTAETETATTQTTPTETAGETTTGTGDGGEEADGEAVFASAGCGSCHTFEPAGTSGTIGPNLGETDLNEDEIAAVVTNGRGPMPSFQGQLSDAEIAAVADYVASG